METTLANAYAASTGPPTAPPQGTPEAQTKQQILADLTADIFGRCEDSAEALDMEPEDIWNKVMLGRILDPPRKLSYYNKFLEEARVMRERAAKAAGEAGGPKPVKQKGVESAEMRAVAADRKRWADLGKDGQAEWGAEYDKRYVAVQKEIAGSLSKTQKKKAVGRMEERLQNALHELSLYDVEAAVIMLPMYTSDLEPWKGRYLVSSTVLDQAVRKKLWDHSAPAGADAVVKSYKRSYDAYYESVVDVGKSIRESAPFCCSLVMSHIAIAEHQKKKKKGGVTVDEHEKCKRAVSSELARVIAGRTVEQEIPWATMWATCVEARVAWEGVPLDFKWKLFGSRGAEAYTASNRAAVLASTFKFVTLDLEDEADLGKLKVIDACGRAYKEAFTRKGGRGKKDAAKQWAVWLQRKNAILLNLQGMSKEAYLKELE